MTRLFLATGVAALAISAPASARPGGGHSGGGNDRQTFSMPPRGGGSWQRVQATQRAAPQRQSFAIQRGGGGFAAPRMQQRFTAVERQPRVARVERQQYRAERIQPRMAAREQFGANRQQSRMVERQQIRANRVQQSRMAERQQLRANRANQVQPRMAERQQLHANRINQVGRRMAQRQQFRGDRQARAQDMMAQRQQFRGDRQARAQDMMAQRQQFRADRQLRTQGLIADRQALRADRIYNAGAFRASRLAALTSFAPRTRVVAPAEAVRFVGQPLSSVTNFMALSPLPATASYLYPDTSDYYYQYGGGYLYQVDRGTNLIAALLPLLAGGYMPGQYLPSTYMNSYVPNYYGFNSFYPDSQYGCNRYADGVVYQVDCATGMIDDVIPMYAGGYGVGQMLPSAYSYYNVPSQYRSLYYDTPDSNYWYAPGAIYQYDQGSSMITSVAALLSPGFTVGQSLPMGYSTYNVPYAYRSTYYDTPTAWYRYNNGYIYQVDPTTQLVSAIVASILT